MSLETSIAGFTTQAGLLLDLPQQIATAAQTQIGLIGTEYANRIASMTKTVYVNQVTGLDTNAGTIASPYKTLQKAIDVTPLGGVCVINLQADYTIGLLNEDVFIYSRHVRIQSDGAVRRRLQFTPYLQAINASTYRNLRSFFTMNNCSLMFFGITLVMPDMGVAPNGQAANAAAILHGGTCMVRPGTGQDCYWTNLGILTCDFEMTANPYGLICGVSAGGYGIHYSEFSVTITGGATSLNGRRFYGAQNTAGTATSGFPNIVTSLTTI